MTDLLTQGLVEPRPLPPLARAARQGTCPCCGYNHVRPGMTPKWLFEGLKPGDLAICTGCTIGLRLDSKMTLQLLTVSEVRFLEATKPDVLRAMREQQADKREMHREMALKRAKAATPASG